MKETAVAKFADIHDVLQALVVSVGVFSAYYYKNATHALVAMAAVCLLIAVEALRKKQISVRGKIVTRAENSKLYSRLVSVYLLGGLSLSVAAVVMYSFE